MKSQKKESVRKTVENVKRFFCKTGSLWFLASIFMISLARALKKLYALKLENFFNKEEYYSLVYMMAVKR